MALTPPPMEAPPLLVRAVFLLFTRTRAVLYTCLLKRSKKQGCDQFLAQPADECNWYARHAGVGRAFVNGGAGGASAASAACYTFASSPGGFGGGAGAGYAAAGPGGGYSGGGG